MSALNLFYNIKEAFETSTLNNNTFAEILGSTEWDSEFTADNEYYFVKGEMTFTTPSLDPFNMCWKPSAIFKDGAVIEL